MMHGWYGTPWMMQGNNWWLGLIGMVIQLLFWAAIIYVVFRLLKPILNKERTASFNEDRSLNILRERFAKGEINSEEFKQLKEELRNQ